MPAGDVPRRIYLMPDYTSSSVWTDEPHHGMVRLDVLPLSQETKRALEAWSEQLWDALDASMGAGSAFDAGAHEAEGQRLWRQVRKELPAEFEVGIAYVGPKGKRIEWALADSG
jgi:hypothetical protein